MDSLSSVSPSIIIPPSNSLRQQCRRRVAFSSHPSHDRLLRLSSFFRAQYFPEHSRRSSVEVCCKLSGGGGVGGAAKEDDGKDELERALHLEGTILGTSDKFVKRVSSCAYDMQRHL